MNWFRNTLRAVKNIYKFISIEDIETYYFDNGKFNNCCHICFDDGDETFYENAFPVLKEMNIPATLFVSPKVIKNGSNYWFQEVSFVREHLDDVLLKEMICEILGCNYSQIKKYGIFSIFACMRLKDILKVIDSVKEKYNINVNKRYNITQNQLDELNKSNIITIGAHTMNHPILSNEIDDDSRKEMCDSVEKLSEMLDRDIKYFAYPNGISGLDYGIREELILQENKIELAFTTDKNFFNKKTNPFSIPRFAFSGLKKENSAWTLSRLLFLPVWDTIRDIVRLGQTRTEVDERKEILQKQTK